MHITIDYLKNHPLCVRKCIEIWYEVLGKLWTPEISIERAIARMSAKLNDNQIPIVFVAFVNQQPVGMCALRANDGIRPDFIYSTISENAIEKNSMAWIISC